LAPHTATSLNWAGQVDLGSITGVQGVWTVPTVVPTQTTEYSSTWVGVDGATNHDLLAIGTTEESANGSTSSWLWFEVLPGGMTLIAPVNPGDSISVDIYTGGGHIWYIFVNYNGGQWSKNGYYPGPASSAEAITDRPAVNGSLTTLANFGQTTFSWFNDQASSHTGMFPINMVDAYGSTLAYPGPVDASSHNSFTTYYVVAAPKVASVWPAQCSTAGGRSVTIAGSYFGDVTSVNVGGASVPFTENVDGTLTITAPAHAAGAVDIAVQNGTGTSPPTPADQITYITPPPVSDRITAGNVLTSVGSLTSPNSEYQLVVQTDGNVVVWGPHGANWSTGSYGTRGDVLAMQTDGNLVLYSSTGYIWNTGSEGLGATELVLQNDGNLVLYGPYGAVWSSLYGFTPSNLFQGQSINWSTHLISTNGAYRLIIQSDGNVVVYGPGGANWSTGTWGTSGQLLVLQSDGNLVLYGTSGPVWSSGTWGSGANLLAMQTDGNLVLYGPGGAVWSSLYG
jgi:hypothetical protein